MTPLRRLQISLAVLALLGSPSCTRDDTSLLLVTTTSVRDSGLLGALMPVFQQQVGFRVRIVAVGSGAALRMGRDGNADVLFTHAPEGEAKLVASGEAVSRTPVMENHFVIAGPSEDPAGVRDAGSPVEAFRRIASKSSPFVSRGDDSGTHRREVALLTEAGLDPDGGWEGYARSGSGMGNTLQIAGEKRAYTLSDLGTFLAFQQRIDLESLSPPSPSLRNVYSVIRLDPQKIGPERDDRAKRFEAFLLAPKTQRLIAEFGRDRFDRPLFRPLHLEQ
jgi:tungstate transport system substrate-binding protein